ncbi:histone-lysine N-methyltransferase SETMAR [Plakobranchus ocellatus]|uniref:Histone-lysine N-methyltransferase SETMAR n=1 Tax=Plakobranchus ocellatus TaxID=259542 RepID=A0AAV4BFZ3_9GAST|nr:histone-lysine N-methyltransferase SETMAR [Plakobranchus ocellatus]
MFSDEHKRQRVKISQILLHWCQQEGDETFNVGLAGTILPGTSFLKETKCDSMTWKHPSSPVTKKFKVQQSATKVMATVFWESRGMILLNILPKGESQC